MEPASDTEEASAGSSTVGAHATLRCEECAARLVHDQRYCLECGARRGPLPADIAALIGAIHEQGPAPELPAEAPLANALEDRPPPAPAFGFAMPGPRAVAVAVMGMLGFGAIVGSLLGGTTVEDLASAPLVVVGLSKPSPTTPAGQTVTTIVQTVGGGAGGTSAAPAAPSPTTVAAAQQTAAAASPTGSSTSPTGNGGSLPTGGLGLPPVKHVFLVVLSNRGYNQSFGPTAPKGYLKSTLVRQGELVQNYYAIAAAPLANEIALISGQGPTAQTASDCPVFSRIRPGTKGPRGQIRGAGCEYPADAKTLADQLAGAGKTWRAYVQGVSASGSACRVPKLGSRQPQAPRSNAGYLAWRNPFVYFRSVTKGVACRQNEAGLGRLATDLKSDKTTPSLAYIVPAACNDGSEMPCRRGPDGLAGANRFLKTVVPEIKRSPAYKAGAMIAITFDQAPQTGPNADPSACSCNTPTTYPNLRGLPAGTPAVPPGAMGPGGTTTTTGTSTAPTDTTGTTTPGTTTPATTTPTDTTTTPTDTTTTPTGTPTTGTTTPTTPSLGVGVTTPTGGGGQVGLLLISRYVKPDSLETINYFNHFSLLATIEDLFGLHHLGYAGVPGLPVLSASDFNNYTGG